MMFGWLWAFSCVVSVVLSLLRGHWLVACVLVKSLLFTRVLAVQSRIGIMWPCIPWLDLILLGLIVVIEAIFIHTIDPTRRI